MSRYKTLKRMREYEKVETWSMVTNSTGGTILLLLCFFSLPYSSGWSMLSLFGSILLFFAALQSYFSRIRIRKERNKLLREEKASA